MANEIVLVVAGIHVFIDPEERSVRFYGVGDVRELSGQEWERFMRKAADKAVIELTCARIRAAPLYLSEPRLVSERTVYERFRHEIAAELGGPEPLPPPP